MTQVVNNKQIKLEHVENMVAIAFVDGSFDEEEKKFLFEKAEEFGLVHSQVQSIIQHAQGLQYIIPKNKVDREEQLADAVYMTMVNEVVNPKEYELCLHLAQKLGLEQKEVDRMIELITKLWKQ